MTRRGRRPRRVASGRLQTLRCDNGACGACRKVPQSQLPRSLHGYGTIARGNARKAAMRGRAEVRGSAIGA
eukprot:9573210-Lingulodinium_polyedra.AAC.1